MVCSRPAPPLVNQVAPVSLSLSPQAAKLDTVYPVSQTQPPLPTPVNPLPGPAQLPEGSPIPELGLVP